VNFTGANRQLRDPTWYRVRYALAVRCMQIATGGEDDRVDENGWPKEMSREQDGVWKSEFGAETQELLLNLSEDQEAVQSPLETPAAIAMERARELLATAAVVLDDAGWHWVGRKPPRYLPLAKRISSWLRRWLLRRKERPVASDVKLTGFLSDVVEPTTMILYCSTRLANDVDGSEYHRLKDAVFGRIGGPSQPLDRRSLDAVGIEEWALEYLSAFLADQQTGVTRHARVEARLGRTQYRAPRKPTPRARYSLACLLSRLAMEADARNEKAARDILLSSSAAQLDGAFSDAPSGRRDRLARWARADPDLSCLRSLREPAFATIVARWGPAERRQVARRKLDSTVVSSVAYMADAKVLELEFADGSRYQYLDVPKAVYEKLIEDDSPGQVFNGEIASKFAFIRA
jgi:hypothetical protein